MAVFTTVIYSLTHASGKPSGSHSLPHGEVSNPKTKNFLSIDKNGEFSKCWWASDLGKTKCGILPLFSMSK